MQTVSFSASPTPLESSRINLLDIRKNLILVILEFCLYKLAIIIMVSITNRQKIDDNEEEAKAKEKGRRDL